MTAPSFVQVNLGVSDMDAAVAFYRLLGLDVPTRWSGPRAPGGATSVTAAGHSGLQPPYDAFWGGRYAVVRDPDGHEVGLMSPIDLDRRYVPEGAAVRPR